MDNETKNRLLAAVRFDKIYSGKPNISQKRVDKMATDINKSWWEKNKISFFNGNNR